MSTIFLHTHGFRKYKPMLVADTFGILSASIRFRAKQTKVIENKRKVYLICIRTHCQSYPIFVCFFVLSPDMNCGLKFLNG